MREKTSDNVQINIRIPAKTDRLLRKTAAAMPYKMSPQKLIIRGIDLAIEEALKKD